MAQAGYLYLFLIFPILNISQLFIDPINKPPYYYSFVVGGSYKVTAKPEINYSPAINDGGIEPLLYEAGTDKKLSTFQSGLVLYLPFDEGSGTTARDLSGFGNNGTLLDASSTNADGNTPPQWTTGKVGSALSFDGVDDYVSLGTFMQLPQGTVLFCGKITDYQQNKGWVFYNKQGYLALYHAPYANSVIVYTPRQPYPTFALSLSSFPLGEFFLIAITWDNSQIKAFINGEQKNSTNVTGVKSFNSSPLQLMGRYIPPSYNDLYTFGILDEFKIYNRALSDSEIKILYEAIK
jgi:hypothetical protein